MVNIEKNKNDLLVILFILFKKTAKPNTPIPAIAVPTESKSRFFRMSMR